MSTVEKDKDAVITLLADLEKSENKPLTRSRNSVRLSFNQMLDHIDKILDSHSILDADIQLLLETYRAMAEKFYVQYENSLLENIKKQNINQLQSSEAINYIGNLKDDDPKKKELSLIIPLLEKARDDADAEYKNLTDNFPALLQNSLDKLKSEWQRLNTIALASQTLEKDEKLIPVLKAVVETAAFTVGIETERIAIVPGDSFALYFFAYLNNFAVLTMPIYSVQAPWEWSILWHELAGYKVRQIEKGTTIKTLKESLENLYSLYTKETDLVKKEALKSQSTYYENSKKYIGSLFPAKEDGELNLNDLGGFEHQFERMLENLPQKNKFQAYDQIKKDGWSVDWFKELFEDGWSVLTIEKPFLQVFDDILSRHVSLDGRHPPRKIRYEVAQELLNLANGTSDVAKKPKTVEESAAKQIFKFIALITYASSFKYYQSYDETRFFDLLARSETLVSWLLEIRDAISKWSKIILEPASAAKEQTEEIIRRLTKGQNFDVIQKMDKKKSESTFEGWLDGKDYKKLLELSFFDVDFNTANVTNVYFGTSLKHSSANLNSLPDDVTDGLVKYDIGTVTHHTSIDKWNAKAANGSKIS